MLHHPAAGKEVNDQGHRGDDEQDVQGKCGDVKKQKAANPKHDENNRERQPHCLCTLRRVSHLAGSYGGPIVTCRKIEMNGPGQPGLRMGLASNYTNSGNP